MALLREVASVQDVSAIKAEIAGLDEETLNSRTQALLEKVNAYRAEHDRLERLFHEASDKLERTRLSDVLHGADGDHLRLAEDLAKAARLTLRQHDVTYQQAQIVLKACQERQQWLVDNKKYRATSFITPQWKQEYSDLVERVRLDLGRLVALYVRLNGIRHTSAVLLPGFVETVLQTPNALVSNEAIAAHGKLLAEAMELYEREGAKKDQQAEAVAEGIAAKAARDKKALEDLGGASKTKKEIIRG